MKLGARYLMTLNNDIQDGLVNGATGLLEKIVYGTKSESLERVPCILWMEFDDPTVGKDKRASLNIVILEIVLLKGTGLLLDWKHDVSKEGKP